MPPLEGRFEQMAISAGVPSVFIEFLRKAGITQADSFAVWCAEEKLIQTEMLDAAKADGHEVTDIKHKIAVKKLWHLARKNLNAPGGSVGGSAKDEDEIPKDSREDIIKVWKATHDFVLPESWLLMPSLQKTLWLEITSDPPKLEIMLLEGMRQQGCTNKGLSNSVTSYSERGRESREVISETVHRPSEIFLRLRAFFCTVAYVTIRKKSWFSLQDAVFMSDKIYKFTNQSFNGYFAPTPFYLASWASTINSFSEKIRIQGMSLSQCVHTTGGWEHFWTSFSPPTVSDRSAGTPGNVGPDMPRDLQDQLRRAREDAKLWREKADRYRNERDGFTEGKGRVKAGAFGKDKGKGKYGNKNKFNDKGRPDQGVKRNANGDANRDPRQRPY